MGNPTTVAWIVVACPDCGEVRVPTREVTLRRCLDRDEWSYRARCGSCGYRFVAGISAATAMRAVAARVETEVWHLPAELDEHPGGPPLGPHDADALHALLARDDWFQLLVDSGISPER